MSKEVITSGTKPRNFPVAIVGMHGRFPGAYDVRDFWANLVEGNNTIGLVPKERWDWAKLFGSSANENDSTTINCAAFMPLADRFDTRFFGILPREAESMDPQQRLFMQTAYAALEDAGHAPGSLAGSNTGVFVGIGNADYPGMMRRDGAAFDIYRATGLALTCIPNRVSFSLNVHGPSEAIDTACSGSLVAIHRAIQSLQLGECDLAIAGGVNLLTGPDLFIAFDKAGMLSKSARCRTFDAEANGYVRGEGVAAVVLRPLQEAEKDGDYIYAVIHGSATNHGGRAHSFTAPNAAAQALVVQAAWRSSGKNFHEAFMIETHGTGTPLGDPIEVNGLKKVSEEFGFDGKAAPSIALGALKSHVGHMEAAAGIGGVIKAVLAMKYRTVPRNLNFNELNPHISLENTPYYIPSANVEIGQAGQQQHAGPLLAGVSSFGFGGVNGHVVLESYPSKTAQPTQQNTPYLIPLSGRDKQSLHARVQQMIHFLKTACGKDARSDSSVIFGALCHSLGISDEQRESGTLTFAALGLSLAQWMGALKDLKPLTGRAVEFAEVQDCISLQEAAQKIARNLEVDQLLQGTDQALLCSRVALPDEEIRSVGLSSIAYSLMQGRDHLRERLACIAHSKEELLAMLQAYMAAPEAAHPWLWTHSVKMNEAALNTPDAPQGSTSIETLATWAVWWVRSKSGLLAWDVLYPQVSRPSKYPLPAYPFQLDRIWYKAAAQPDPLVQPKVVQGAIQPVDPANELPSTQHLQKPLLLLSKITEAWQVCMADSQLRIPASVMSLAYLLDYAVHKNGGPVLLKNAIFGPPGDMQDASLVFSDTQGVSTRVIQCLKTGNANKVLIQAELKQALLPPASPEAFLVETLTAAEFISRLEKRGILLGRALQCVEAVYAGSDGLSIKLSLPDWKARDGRFWVPVIVGMLAGWAYQQKETLRLPWRIRSVFFDAESTQAAETLHLATYQGMASATLMGKANKPMLQLEGVILRESALVQPGVKQLEARAA